MEATKNPRILLVEDNLINQKVVVLTLKHLGYNCDVASNGKEAFEMFKMNSYDLIFMDIQMPVIDGLEATRLIRGFEKSLGIRNGALIIALTASESAEFGGKYLEVGMDGFIEKPLRSDLLSKYIDQLFNSRKNEIIPKE